MRIPGRRRSRQTRKLHGWGRVAPATSHVTRVTDEAEATRAVAPGRPGRGLVPRGLGRSYGDAAQLDGGEVLDATRLAAIGPVHGGAAHATVDVGGGVSLGDLARRTVPLGWLPPVLPGTRHVTIGGAIAADVHGKNHHRDGGFGRYVHSLHLATADGQIRLVSREDDRPLFEATVGGMGLTGIITSARLELEPITTAHVEVTTSRTRDLDATLAMLLAGDEHHRYSVAWIDLARPGARGRGLVQQGNLAPRPPGVDTDEESPAYQPRPALTAPPLPGRGVVRTHLVRAFNAAYWRQPLRSPRLIPLPAFFHPLDVLAEWSRLYGSTGLLQYQCVIPDGEEPALRRLVEAFTEAPVTPALAVLKRLGPSGEGMLSFPLRGWTLAVDLPAHEAETYLMLDRMDEVVATAGGRVYLAKDARLRSDLLEEMYPRLGEWLEVKQRIDPGDRIRSDLAERLGLLPTLRSARV